MIDNDSIPLIIKSTNWHNYLLTIHRYGSGFKISERNTCVCTSVTRITDQFLVDHSKKIFFILYTLCIYRRISFYFICSMYCSEIKNSKKDEGTLSPMTFVVNLFDDICRTIMFFLNHWEFLKARELFAKCLSNSRVEGTKGRNEKWRQTLEHKKPESRI